MYCVLVFFWSLTVPLLFSFHQGRHVKTGQLAAIKVMDVTGVRCTFHTHTHARTPTLQINSSDYATVDHVI